MNFFKRLFGSKEKSEQIEQKKNPENTRLNFLLDIYGQHPSIDNYKAVMEEITEGNGSLLLPSVNEKNGSGN